MALDSQRRMLILDFDGVLVDTEPVHFESWNRAFEELLGFQLEGDYRQLVGLTLDEIYHLWIASPTGKRSTIHPEMKAALLARKTEHYFMIGADRLIPMPGSIDLLRQAHRQGWYTAIASRGVRLRLHRTLDLIHMPALFDAILGLEDLVDPQTDRKIHSRAADMFNIKPSDCVVVEDSVSGVADAVACGIGRVIGFAHSISRDALLAAGAHEVVERLNDVQL